MHLFMIADVLAVGFRSPLCRRRPGASGTARLRVGSNHEAAFPNEFTSYAGLAMFFEHLQETFASYGILGAESYQCGSRDFRLSQFERLERLERSESIPQPSPRHRAPSRLRPRVFGPRPPHREDAFPLQCR